MSSVGVGAGVGAGAGSVVVVKGTAEVEEDTGAIDESVSPASWAGSPAVSSAAAIRSG